MARSLKKGPLIDEHLKKKVLKAKLRVLISRFKLGQDAL